MRIKLALLAASILGLTACAGMTTEAKYPAATDRVATNDIYSKPQSIFGEGGILGYLRRHHIIEGETSSNSDKRI
ncbi:MAG TPA: hypothetical protein VIF12_08355 [Micavibrio sp.]|jgi:hypothetical protein